MIKETLLIGLYLLLATAAILKTSEESNIKPGCKSEFELWGSEDCKKFYFCLGNNQSLEEECPPNTFFINNSTVQGCIPFDIVSSNCIDQSKPPDCEGIALYQPQPHQDPTKYYYCTGKGAVPKVAQCQNGTAFINADGWLGCLPWSEWRQARGCNPTA